MSFSPEIDIHEMYRKLSVLEEEEPQLQLVWQEETSEIHARVMGEVQIEILQSLIRERFGVEAFFTSGSIIYKETVENTVEGIGHFEPLRHYAEVHLLIEPENQVAEWFMRQTAAKICFQRTAAPYYNALRRKKT